MLLFDLKYLPVYFSHNTFKTLIIYQFFFATEHKLFKSAKRHLFWAQIVPSAKRQSPFVSLLFSDSIVKEIKIRKFNQFITNRNARTHSFPGATSKQLLYYMDVNLERNIDTIIVHIHVNDTLQDSTPDVINYIKNVERLVQKCRAFGVKQVLLSGIVYTKRISLNTLEDIHNPLVNLSRNLDICYFDNRDIRGSHLFKNGSYILESGKKMLVNKFKFYFNNFLLHKYKHIVPI